MPGISEHTSQDVRDLELLDSVIGSATACANISTKLDTLKRTTAGCLSGPLSLLVNDFSLISESYTTIGHLVEHSQPVWNQNVFLSIKLTQRRCQDITAEISTILDKHGEWTVLAADGCCYRLNLLSKGLRMHRMHHHLLLRTSSFVGVLSRKPADYIPSLGSDLEFQMQLIREKQTEKWSRSYESSFAEVLQALVWKKECLGRFQNYQRAEASLHERLSQASNSSEKHVNLDDWSTTNSTIGIMTPTEDWSDMASDTTEIGRVPAITRHGLQLCGYATASFLRLLEDTYQDTLQWGPTTLVEEKVQRLHKAYAELVVNLLHGLDAPVPFQDHPARSASVPIEITRSNMHSCIQNTKMFLGRINATERSFIDLPGATPVDITDIEAMHKAYKILVNGLCYCLVAPIPFQNGCPTSEPVPATNPAPASRPAPEIPKLIMPEEQEAEGHVDKAVQAIIDSMESEPTEEDISKLVFHWSILDECNFSKRADVMKFN